MECASGVHQADDHGGNGPGSQYAGRITSVPPVGLRFQGYPQFGFHKVQLALQRFVVTGFKLRGSFFPPAREFFHTVFVHRLPVSHYRDGGRPS